MRLRTRIDVVSGTSSLNDAFDVRRRSSMTSESFENRSTFRKRNDNRLVSCEYLSREGDARTGNVSLSPAG